MEAFIRTSEPFARPSRVTLLVRILSASAIAVGLTVIVGWVTHISILTTVLPGFVSMKMNTAYSFILCGLAVQLLSDSSPQTRWRNALATALGAVVMLIGLLVLVEYSADVDLHIDDVFRLQGHDLTSSVLPGRMSPVSAFNFVCLGVAIVLLALRRAEGVSQILSTIAFVAGAIAIIGYLFGATALYAAGHYTAVALNTSIGFVITAAATLFLRPRRGLVGILNLRAVAGSVARRFIPVAIALPVIAGWLRISAQHHGWIGTETGLSLYCLTNIFGFIALIRWNTTHLLNVEKSLRESTGRYQLLADSIPQLIWSTAPNGIVTYCNEAWCEYAGLTLEQTKAGEWRDLIHREDVHDYVSSWQHSVATGTKFEREARFKRAADGAYRWHLARGVALRNAAGAIVEWVGTCTDIDDQKRAEEHLEAKVSERTAELDAILDNSVDVICTIDNEGRFIRVSRACQEVWGYAAEELIGRRYIDFVCPDDHEKTNAAAAEIMAGERVMNFQNRYVRKDGTLVPIVWSATWEPELGIMFCVARNASDQARVEAALNTAKESAEAANKSKSEFLANMSHEIRTPMNGIIGMTELALETNLNDVQREYLEGVKHSADSLLSLINDILDFSKIEAGKLALESIPFELRSALEKTLKALRLRAQRKSIALKDDVDPAVPWSFVGDPLRLCQVIINLIDNAIKFTDQGEVSLSVKVADEDADNVTLDFAISDTGIGIPLEKQNAIFAAFAQADGSTTRTYGGTGLGLAICSQLVAQMHGKLTVESAPGCGSTFRFLAQFRRADAIVMPTTEDDTPILPNKDTLRILVADDNPINQAVARGILRQHGHIVRTASNGREAVAIYQREALDLILMDVQMPELDGFAATARIREIETENAGHIPIVAMTAHAMDGDRQRCLDAGMDDYIAKPVNKKELLDAVARIGGNTLRKEDVDLAVKHQLLARFDGDADLLHRVSRMFIEQTPDIMQRIKDANAKSDATALRETAHSFIGSLGTLGAETAVGYARQLEKLAELKAFNLTGNLITKLERELDTFQSRLERID